jgi:hypothetical protein
VSVTKQRAREAQAEIAEILRHDWNPIGLVRDGATHDEYYGYVGEVYTLLSLEPSAQQLAKYLSKSEAHSLGFDRTDPEMLLPVAEKLLAVDVPRRTWALKSPGKEVVQAIVTSFIAVVLTLIAVDKPLRLLSVVVIVGAVSLAGFAIYQAVVQVRRHGSNRPAA